MKSSIYSTQYSTLRSWLKGRREELGLSLRQVGEQAGRHHSIFGKLETDRKIDIVEFVEYCEILELDPHEGIELIKNSTNSKP